MGQDVACDRRPREQDAPRPVGECLGHRLGDIAVGHEIGDHAEPAQGAGRAGPDGGHLHTRKSARVVQVGAEALHAVDGREGDPVVLPQSGGGPTQAGAAVGRLLDHEGGQFDGFRPELAQSPDQLGGLLAGPRHHHPAPEQRPGLEPAQVELGHTADHHRHRRLELH